MKNDSLIYSVSYENYQTKILEDKINKTQGSWTMNEDMFRHLKYAYVYLKNSKQMIVKKYEIEQFEKNDVTKGYDDEDKYCFIFNKSEDVFFEYPHSTVQGRHYRDSVEMDKLPRLEKSEIDTRLNLSKNTKTSSELNRKEKRKKTGIVDTAQVQLREVWKKEFSDRKLPPHDIARQMIESVEQDPEQDINALLTEYYVAEDNKKS